MERFDIAVVGVPVALTGFALYVITPRWLLPEGIPAGSPGDRTRMHIEFVVGAQSPHIGKA